MPWETVAKCDECGKVKGEANKWLLALPEYRKGLDYEGFLVCHWSEEVAQFPSAKMLCSEACLQKRLGAFLAQRTKEAPANLQVIKE
jgi:hypothetical protein